MADPDRTPPLPPRDAVDAEEVAAYDRVIARQAAYGYDRFADIVGTETPSLPSDGIQPYFGALLNSPLIADHISELGVVYRTRGERTDSYQHRDREWIDMVLAVELEMWFICFVHVVDGVANGVRPAAVRALLDGRDDHLEPDELLQTQYIRQVVNGTVTPASFGAIRERFGARGAVEFTSFIGHLLMTIRLQQAFGVEDVPRAQLEDLVDRLVAGTVALPDPQARIPQAQTP